MGDIKAKDLNTAGSVAAGDKILGSSINGTTANVTVETVGKYIIDQLGLTSLNNGTVSGNIAALKNLTSGFSNIQYVSDSHTTTTADRWEYTGLSLTIPANKTYAVWGGGAWDVSASKGIALSVDHANVYPVSIAEATPGTSIPISKCPVIIASNKTLYLFEKKFGTGTNSVYIYYVDLGTTT